MSWCGVGAGEEGAGDQEGDVAAEGGGGAGGAGRTGQKGERDPAEGSYDEERKGAKGEGVRVPICRGELWLWFYEEKQRRFGGQLRDVRCSPAVSKSFCILAFSFGSERGSELLS